MGIVTMTSVEFDRNPAEALRAAETAPVYIIDLGKASHVLLSIEEYRKLSGNGMTLANALAQDDPDDMDFEAPKLGSLFRAADYD